MSNQPQNDKPKNRKLYDYSRSSGSSGHWYSGGSHSNPLASSKSSASKTSRQQRRTSERSTRVRDRVEKRRRYQEKGIPNNWVWMIIAGTMVGMTIISALILMSMAGSDKNSGKASANSQNLVEPTSILYNESSDGNGALEGNSLIIEPWTGEERFTVLLMGLDTRPDETNAACRTDTMMVVSIDPVTDRIGILSIPRDTYVEVPNYGLRKINTACVIGNLELNGRGPQLAMQTIQYNFGIEVNDYLMVDFNTFIEIIDLIGGIDVNAVQTIDDPEYPDMNYGYDPFYLEAGPHHLDGATALKYSRSRYASDDIDRGRRQQEVVFAVRNRVLSRDMVDDLITRAIPLWNELNDGVDTGLSLEQLLRLAAYAKDIPDENIKSAVLDWDYLVPYNSPEDGSVLVPNRELIAPLLLDVFGEGYSR